MERSTSRTRSLSAAGKLALAGLPKETIQLVVLRTSSPPSARRCSVLAGEPDLALRRPVPEGDRATPQLPDRRNHHEVPRTTPT